MHKRSLLACFVLFFGSIANAQLADSDSAKNSLRFSGNVDVFWRHSANEAASTTHFPTLDHHRLGFGWANLATEWQRDRWHVLADLAVGPRSRAFAGTVWHGFVQQLTVDFRASELVKITGGYFYFPFTVEYAQPGKNWTYSYSILYSSIPVANLGAKVDYAFSKNWTTWAAIFGDPNARLGAFHPHLSFGLGWARDGARANMNFVVGNDFDSVRMVSVEVNGTLPITKKLQAVLDVVIWTSQPGGRKTAQFSSLVGYLNYEFGRKCSLAARGEVFSDPNALFFGELDNQIFALTLAPRFQFGNVIFQPEFRVDNASKAIFPRGDSAFSTRESAVTLVLIYKFGTYPE